MKSRLTAIYWNVWLEVQNGKRDDGAKLTKRLQELVEGYSPNFIGLNEVLVHQKTKQSKVIECLESLGYHVHFAPFSPISDEWMIGGLLASKAKPLKVTNHLLGPDTQAKRRGYPGFNVYLIEGKFKLGDKELTFVVNYLGNLIPIDWGTHIRHRRSFNRYITNLNYENVIIGGDFNEPKYLWTWLKTRDKFLRKTGNLLNPTWCLNGKSSHLLASNYDYVLYPKNSQLKLTKFEVLYRQPSDHSPLLAQFKLF